MKIFLDKQAAAQLKQYATLLPHAVLLTGPEGVGLRVIATEIAGKRLCGVIEPTDIKGNVDHTSSGVIRITQIRDLASSAINKSRNTRIYIIDDADRMNTQAQNAFLKLLEEPAPHVHFLLLTHSDTRILPTILSRVQTLRIPPITHEQSEELLDLLKVHDDTKRTQLLFLADGLPAELTRLATDIDGFARKVDTITSARQLLQGTTLEKLALINTIAIDRVRTLEVLAYAQRILAHSMQQHPTSELAERANQLGDTYDQIAGNGHIRIQLLGLVV